MIAQNDAKDLELKKHVGSIHCSNTLTLLQRKISNVLLYHAYDELLEKEDHEIAIKTLCSLIGYSSHDYDTIKRALKALISTVLEWNLLGDTKSKGMEDWNASSILSSVGIKGGICTYSYSNRLKKLLYMPEIYGRINIAIQARFKSNYALALYENCIRYQNLTYTRWFALTTFRKLMGVPDGKYIIFRDFKRRVLDKSVAEVNSYSDLTVEPQIEREGQKVHRIRFKLYQKHSEIEPLSVEAEIKKRRALLASLLEFGFSEEQAKPLLEKYDPDFIVEKIALIKSSNAYIHNKVHNLPAYLKSALRENYTGIKKKNSNKEQPYSGACKDEALKKAYDEYVSARIDETFEKLDEARKEFLQQEFQRYLQMTNNTFVLKKYNLNGVSNHIVKCMLRTFIRENFDINVPSLLSFDEFVKQRID